ncbi:MFS transporter [Desulfomarina profundi]|uniref:MFS transporter n=1 Tax=Desulfomarina profundi TaxID=2772557 RepID=A0A8D5FGJ7_9BACT|nr:MFS transporter [Desulfomarina profundi]BCL60241.1 MFS transporter [Desulfomarina profundi]
MKQQSNQTEREQVRWARKRFIAMAGTYFLGVFNDNFFKQAILLLAVAAGLNQIQGYATELFSLPFILFSAWGGWLADRFAKRRVVIGVKFLELMAMLIGAYGILTMNWPCVLSMVFLMGLQSTLFGPALNGSIPELYPRNFVTRANAVLKLVTTVAILLGMALAGFALDLQLMSTSIPFGRIVVACAVVCIGLLGVLASFGVYSRPAGNTHVSFPWSGPLHSIRDLVKLKKDPLLLLAVFCDSFFYFVSLLAVLVINTLGLQQLGLSASRTSLLAVSLMVGVCFGALAAAKITSHSRWTHVLPWGSAGMGISLAAAGGLVTVGGGGQFLLLLCCLVLAGSFGGLFLIPVTSFIQVRPGAGDKGKVIAAANFLAFSCMLLAGRLFPLLDGHFQPAVSMQILGAFSLLAGLVISLVLKLKLS